MLLGNIRPELHSNCRSSRSAPHVTPSPTVQTPISTPSNHPRTPITSQQTMMNYARMSYRYTTVTLLSLRPQPEISVFPDHLVERRFLDEENYIDLDRMLVEKAGKFRFEPYGMLDGAGDGLIMPSRVHKYDFSDPVVIEKVKNRRPKDPMTPHQVAALTSVVTRHQPSTVPTPLLSTHPNPASPHVWIDDYSRRQAQLQRQPQRNHFPPQPSMPYQRQNPNQCETYTNPGKPILPGFSPELQANSPTVPILQRLFQAQQQRQQHEERKVHADQTPLSSIGGYPKGLSTFATPTSPQTSKPSNTFAWPFSTNSNQSPATHPLHLSLSTQATVKQNQDVLTQLINEHLRCSTTLQTPVTASGPNKLYSNHSDDEEDEQHFYSAPPSPTGATDSAASNFFDHSENPEQSRVYQQGVLLNTLIRNMVKEQEKSSETMLSSASNESCLTDESQSTKTHSEHGESYTEMYNLVRLLSPGVKSVAQQELLHYLEQGCAVEREEMLRLVASLNINEQNALKPVLLRLINEQTEVLKQQQDVQQGQSPSNLHQRFAHHLDQSRSPLESWFGAEIYKNAFPRMPSGRVVSACDLEQSRLSQQN